MVPLIALVGEGLLFIHVNTAAEYLDFAAGVYEQHTIMGTFPLFGDFVLDASSLFAPYDIPPKSPRMAIRGTFKRRT